MATERCIELLKSQQNSDETINILIKIANNIIANPNNAKLRNLRKENRTVSTKILAINGGIDCLKSMGFEEEEKCFVMPSTVSVDKIRNFRDMLLKIRHKATTTTISQMAIRTSPNGCDNDDLNIKKFTLPPIVPKYNNPFLRQIELHFHSMLEFEDPPTKQHAKSLIPLIELEIKAQMKLRSLQQQIRKGLINDDDTDINVSIQDFLIIELLEWFKFDFFEWIDSPQCQYCSNQCKFSHISTDRKDFIYTERVEVHRCTICHKFTNFPRYNDLNILLETRRGRCGEWARVFTLLCRTLGWETRLVVDELDHLWTEVYSIAQQRWIHCDPCENAYDTPLMYEIGWKKQLTYIIAYTIDDVQDVTWRYSCNHKGVLKRRKHCTEQQLIDALIDLRQRKQSHLSELRRKYLTGRLLKELSEFLFEKKPSDKEFQGRLSGSLAWRTSRGETQNETMYIWKIEKQHIINNTLTIQYSAALDCYHYITGNGDKKIVNNWESGVYSCSNIFRKEEKDWKTVYLARNEGSDSARISWKFELNSNEFVIDRINLKFNHKTYETGLIDIKLESDGRRSVDYRNNLDNFETANFQGCRNLTITASLSGGKGDIAWQHTQLFRQAIDSEDFPFVLKFYFK